MDKHNGLHVNTLYLEITDKCNYSCKYCYNRSCASNKKYLSNDAFQRAVTCFSHWGLKAITYSGGEPLLHPGLKAFLDYGQTHNVSQLIITNGSMLNEEWCDYVRKNNILLQFTMDGSSESINDFTRGKGAYTATIAALELIQRAELSNRLIMRYNISYFNQADIEDFVRFISRYKIRRIEFSLVMANGRGQNFECIDKITNSELIRELNQRIVCISESEGIHASLINNDISLACPIQLGGNGLRVKIDSMGNIYPCQSLFGKEFALCNIYDDVFDYCVFADCFNKYAKRLSELNFVGTECFRCRYHKLCRGSCIADTVQYTQLGMCEQLCATRKASYYEHLLNSLRRRRTSD